ncbi:MAG: hypothetical protein JF924_20660 [Candidatus Dormibacteraeota bacterium]|nr:hypothetical protein [Candidatus Dormibacteraeota bacterium]
MTAFCIRSGRRGEPAGAGAGCALLTGTALLGGGTVASWRTGAVIAGGAGPNTSGAFWTGAAGCEGRWLGWGGGESGGGPSPGRLCAGGRSGGGPPVGVPSGGGVLSEGVPAGCAPTGGTPIGGLLPAGVPAGGAVTGGTVTGGAVTGGTLTGGVATGGTLTGGALTGGALTGGRPPGAGFAATACVCPAPA